MNHLALILCCALFSPAFSLGQWVQQSSGFPQSNTAILDIIPIDENVAWASGLKYSNPGLYFTRTIDGGQNWEADTITTGPYSEFACFTATDENHGWALVFESSSNAIGTVLKTVDGGLTWTRPDTNIFQSSGSFPDVIYFWNNETGVTIGDPVNGEFEIYTTTDGGDSWIQTSGLFIPDPLASEYGFLRFYATYNNIIWFGTTSGRVFKSVDHGQNWVVLPGVFYPAFLNSENLVFWDEFNGIENNSITINRTNDGGQTWDSISNTGYFCPFDVCLIPNTNGILVSSSTSSYGSPGSSYSLDHGTTWITIDSLVSHSAVNFYNQNIGWAGGQNQDQYTGGVYKYQGGIPTATSEPPLTKLNLIIYSNPCNEFVYISASADNLEPIQIDVMDLRGISVMSKTFPNKNFTRLTSLNISQLEKGIYLLRMKNGGAMTTRKIVMN